MTTRQILTTTFQTMNSKGILSDSQYSQLLNLIDQMTFSDEDEENT